MAFAVNDRVKETSTTTGTGTFTLAGAVEGFDTFLSAIGNTNTTYYAITNQGVLTEFEVGIGTVVSGTLTRDTVISSSNSDAAVNFSAGEKNVFCTLPASKAVLENDSGVASATTFSGSGAQLTNLNASNVASGTLDNARLDAELAAIGGLTSAADKGIQFTGSGTAGTFDLTTAGKALLDDADAAAQRTTLGLGSIATLNTVTLTTDTTGDYVASLTAGNLIDLQNNSGEGATPTIDVDLSELTTSTSDADGDFFCVVDSANAQKKLTKANINISGFNNDAGYGTGDITAVTAGNGLTGGGTTGAVTLDVGAGTGIDVAADAISVDVSDFMTNGSNNRVLTATGTDAMNAEANLTFDGSALTVTGNVVPGTNDTYDLGASGNVWRNLYTGDLHLSNEAKDEGNAVDGTKGNWTIQEGAEHLYILNNKSGKKYKFKLEEV